MLILIFVLGFLLLLAGFLGYRRTLRLDHLDQQRVLYAALTAMIILTLMSIAHWLNIISQSLAARITMGVYTVIAGFFLGYALKLIRLRSQAGTLEYMYRSFWTDVAPNIISVALFVFGIYRFGFQHWPYITGIGITSGLSLIGFGFLGWTVHVVPEFRDEGIFLLDQFIEWEKIVTYQWETEDILQIEYLTQANQISEFRTLIPDEDQLIIERLLGKKLKEHQQERKKIMTKDR